MRDPATSAEFHRIRHLAAIKSWDKRGRKKDKPPAPAVSRGDWRSDTAEAERQLAASPVAGAKPLGGGISETYKIELANGMKANFKVSDTPEREVAAWEVAKLVGMDDLVPPAVIREVGVPGVLAKMPPDRFLRGREPGVKRGSAALWKEGTVAGQMDRVARFDGDEDAQRAAMFDYVIGNCDRHDGNWVVDDNGKIGLIDHNLAFDTYPSSEFLNHVKRWLGGASTAKYIAPYLAKKSEIADRLRKTGLPEKKIEGVLKRIDYAGSAARWWDITGAAT